MSAAQATDQTTEGGQIGTQSANQTTASVIIRNQTSNGSTVTIENATLPEGGFVVIHDSEYVENRAPADSSVIAVSEPLDAGTHRNVTVDISNAPPGNYPGLNRSRLNNSQPLAATVYRDANNNQRFDYVQSFGENDTAYISEGELVSDTAGINVPSAEEERRTASVSFNSQTLQNNTVVVEQAHLPQGGFLVAHNGSYQQTNDPLISAVGISRYLSPGNYTNISVRILSDALTETQTVTIIPATDSNDNQQYDYVQSNGFQDVAYETLNRSGVVSESAQVRISTSSTEPPQTQVTTPTATAPSAATQNASGGSDESGGLLNSLGIVGVVVILAVLTAGIIAIRRIL